MQLNVRSGGLLGAPVDVVAQDERPVGLDNGSVFRGPFTARASTETRLGRVRV